MRFAFLAVVVALISCGPGYDWKHRGVLFTWGMSNPPKDAIAHALAVYRVHIPARLDGLQVFVADGVYNASGFDVDFESVYHGGRAGITWPDDVAGMAMLLHAASHYVRQDAFGRKPDIDHADVGWWAIADNVTEAASESVAHPANRALPAAVRAACLLAEAGE